VGGWGKKGIILLRGTKTSEGGHDTGGENERSAYLLSVKGEEKKNNSY